MKIFMIKDQIIKWPILVTLLILLVVVMGLPQTAKAEFNSAMRLSTSLAIKEVDTSRAIFSDVSVIGSNELGKMRGGFKIAGLEINIGALIRTYIDGKLAMHSQLTVTDNGRINNTIAAPASSEIPGASVISTSIDSPSLQEVTPLEINVDGLEGSEGVVVNDNRGYTAALQSIHKDRFLTTIINRASGRNIRHKVDIDVTIKNFTQLQKNARSARLAQQISNR